MTRSGIIHRLLPWAGVIGAFVGWGGSHQLGSDTAFATCTAGDVTALVASAAGLIIAVIGGVTSFGIWSNAGESEGRRFAGLLGTLLALLAGFAIVLQLIAPLILPPCAG